MLCRKHVARSSHECKASQCGDQFSTKNPSFQKLESRGNQCQRTFVENAKEKVDPPGDTSFIVTAIVDKNNEEQSDCTRLAKLLSEKESNSLSVTSRAACTRCNDQTVKSKKDASCQTTFSGVKSHRGNSKRNHVEQSSKEDNNYVSTNASSSKDIETIFATTSFDDEKGKTSPASRKRRTRRTDKRSRKRDAGNSSREKRSRTPCANTGAKRSVFNREASKESSSEATRVRKFVKRKRHETSKDKVNSSTETFFDCDNATNFVDGDSTKISPRDGRKEPLTFVENYDIRNILNNCCNRNNCPGSGEIYVNSPGGGTLNARVSSRNYRVEDKASELMILGNVKKRLEEDYDDYFSVDNDLFLDAEDPSDIVKADPLSMDRYNTGLRCNNPNEPRSVTMTASVTKHQQMKQELTKRSIRTSLTCTSSICFTNSDLSCNRSSYHTSMREQECSPSTSIEHGAANNVSPLNFQSFGDYSFNSFVQRTSANNSKTSGWENCFSNDEFLDRALVNSYTVCCYQQNSTPNLSNSSKLIAESLDSGILTDCSCDQLRVASNEDVARLGEKSKERVVKQDRKRHARKNDLLPVCDLNTDSSYSDDSLNRRVDIVVKKFTDNLILSERRARTKLRSMGNSSGHGQVRKRRKRQVCTQ